MLLAQGEFSVKNEFIQVFQAIVSVLHSLYHLRDIATAIGRNSREHVPVVVFQ